MNPCRCTCENGKYLKSVDDDSQIACDEIINVLHIASTKKTNTIATAVSLNCHSEKVRYKIDCYILHKVSSLIILLLMITT